jgi:hypothetical protein
MLIPSLVAWVMLSLDDGNWSSAHELLFLAAGILIFGLSLLTIPPSFFAIHAWLKSLHEQPRQRHEVIGYSLMALGAVLCWVSWVWAIWWNTRMRTN